MTVVAKNERQHSRALVRIANEGPGTVGWGCIMVVRRVGRCWMVLWHSRDKEGTARDSDGRCNQKTFLSQPPEHALVPPWREGDSPRKPTPLEVGGRRGVVVGLPGPHTHRGLVNEDDYGSLCRREA